MSSHGASEENNNNNTIYDAPPHQENTVEDMDIDTIDGEPLNLYGLANIDFPMRQQRVVQSRGSDEGGKSAPTPEGGKPYKSVNIRPSPNHDFHPGKREETRLTTNNPTGSNTATTTASTDLDPSKISINIQPPTPPQRPEPTIESLESSLSSINMAAADSTANLPLGHVEVKLALPEALPSRHFKPARSYEREAMAEQRVASNGVAGSFYLPEDGSWRCVSSHRSPSTSFFSQLTPIRERNS